MVSLINYPCGIANYPLAIISQDREQEQLPSSSIHKLVEDSSILPETENNKSSSTTLKHKKPRSVRFSDKVSDKTSSSSDKYASKRILQRPSSLPSHQTIFTRDRTERAALTQKPVPTTIPRILSELLENPADSSFTRLPQEEKQLSKIASVITKAKNCYTISFEINLKNFRDLHELNLPKGKATTVGSKRETVFGYKWKVKLISTPSNNLVGLYLHLCHTNPKISDLTIFHKFQILDSHSDISSDFTSKNIESSFKNGKSKGIPNFTIVDKLIPTGQELSNRSIIVNCYMSCFQKDLPRLSKINRTKVNINQSSIS